MATAYCQMFSPSIIYLGGCIKPVLCVWIYGNYECKILCGDRIIPTHFTGTHLYVHIYKNSNRVGEILSGKYNIGTCG